MKKFAWILVFHMAFLITAKGKELVLPDSCGDNKVDFEITSEKTSSPLTPPPEGKALIVLIETVDRPPMGWLGCPGCKYQSRFGMDGAWVGAMKGNAYVLATVDPGVHHLCAVMGKNVGVEAITTEAGKTYYFEAKFVGKPVTRPGGANGEGTYGVDVSVFFTLLSEDEGKYKVKISELSTSTPKKH